ncbi:hypothetical protein [Chryseobacterium kwangjuense]|uniref:Uncharacterized protein n=1 Tax=Chryseobacterium kwangjuense TaxID=267125 RepID=A0A135WES9_9FLAO|nr:hypothetical protein [Chryseobacterium kwangjuense]KXH83418.1 hypothetical protein AU378_13560 [Chryseobacterium kwangjuense]
METTVQNQEQLQYTEVYISDMLSLKNIFLQSQNLSGLNHNFGLPFLLAKKKNTVMAFASLVIDENGEISFKIHGKNRLTDAERQNFTFQAEKYFRKNNTANFRNAEQLKSSISRVVGWQTIG